MKIVQTNEFEQEVASGVVLVDCYADWCGPCKMLGPVLEKASLNYEGRVSFVKVNVDNSPEIANRFGIMSIPTVLLFKDGQLVNQHLGFMNPQQVNAFVESAL